MFQKPFFQTALILSLLVILLTGCSRQADSKPIATYPIGQSGGSTNSSGAEAPAKPPIAQYPLPPSVVYHASIELRVVDVDQAAQQAAGMASKYGGYLANLQSWQVNGRQVTSLDLVVPTANFDGLRLSLRKLGDLLSETISGEPLAPAPGQSPLIPSYSTITVQLQSGTAAWPVVSDTGWSPGRTFQHAFGVFLTIFGFLADILIWFVVVVGPFLLIGAAGYWLARRLRRTA